MQDASYPAHLLPAAGPAGAAVHEHGQRCAVTSGFLGIVGVEHEQPAVPGRYAEHDLASEIRVASYHRTDQAAAAARR